MRKNDVIEGDIIAYGCEGEGILKSEGVTVFVPFAAKGERVKVQILKCGKCIAFAKLLTVITPSVARVEPNCSTYAKCGGCRLLHLDYNEQLEYKRSLIAETLEKIAFLKTNPLNTVESVPQFGYRVKLALPVRSENGELKIGFFARNSHRVVEVDSCALHGDWATKIIFALKNYMREYSIEGYDEKNSSGKVRHLVVKKSGESFIVILVATTACLSGIKFFSVSLEKCIGKHSLYVNVNKNSNNVILGDEYHLIDGEGFICSEWEGLTYKIGPKSFMQVNEYVKNSLYKKACEFLSENKTVIDAYCGTGLLTCALAKKSARAIGVEIVDEAVDLAKALAAENGVNNAEFICAPCEQALPPLIEKLKNEGENVVVYLDPPRKGLDKAVIKALLKAAPNEIIYISCSPQTLARDLGLLLGTLKYNEAGGVKKSVDCAKLVELGKTVLPSGYKIEYLRGYDMFAGCKDVETLVVLSKIR